MDIDMGDKGKPSNKEIFDYIKKNLSFDQLINEHDYSWIHVSYESTGKQRKQILKAKKVNGKTVYETFK